MNNVHNYDPLLELDMLTCMIMLENKGMDYNDAVNWAKKTIAQDREDDKE